MHKLFLVLGSINAALAVILGAFGAHGLKTRITADLMEVFQTGVQYHFYHALGLLILGLIIYHFPESNLLRWSGWVMLAGIILFSGSLYLMAFTGARWLGAITPAGGIAFIASWLLLVIALLR